MKHTGVFYHDICGREAYSSLAMGVDEGFQGIKHAGFFNYDNVTNFVSRTCTEKEIARIHTKNWIEEVKRGQYWNCSLYSIGGILDATIKVLNGELDNALTIAGVGGHHAHRDSAWGGCYFSVTGLAIPHARELTKARRFAIVDTDTHHADGVRDIFKDDNDVLHICLCRDYGWDYEPGSLTANETKLCFAHGGSNDEEVAIVAKEVPERVRKFKPDMIFWIMGMDTHMDSYGTQALTEKAYPRLAEVIKKTADEVCGGKLIVKTCCNAPPHATSYALPRVVDVLSELDLFKGDYRNKVA